MTHTIIVCREDDDLSSAIAAMEEYDPANPVIDAWWLPGWDHFTGRLDHAESRTGCECDDD